MGKDVFIEVPPITIEMKAHNPSTQNQITIIKKNGSWVIVDKEGNETPYSQGALLAILNRN
jgi:hypothetical protein